MNQSDPLIVSIKPLHGPLPPFSRLAHEPVAHSNKFGIHLVLHVVGGKVVVVKPGTQPLEGGEVARPPRRRKAGEGAVVVRLGVQVQRVSAPAGESAEGLFVSLENKKKKRKKKGRPTVGTATSPRHRAGPSPDQ